ncbi:MAG: PLP-dependent transferase [Actinobacteria bacterium]|nr:PLP-dependent transferase [Actinomycetota bacterium]
MSVLEGGKTLLFSSGMAAISAVFSLLPEGAVIVAANNGYQGSDVPSCQCQGGVNL